MSIIFYYNLALKLMALIIPLPFFFFFYRNKKRFHHQALVEVEILEHLRKKDLEANASHNVIHMLEYFYFRNHLCITFELMRYILSPLIFKYIFFPVEDTILEMTNVVDSLRIEYIETLANFFQREKTIFIL